MKVQRTLALCYKQWKAIKIFFNRNGCDEIRVRFPREQGKGRYKRMRMNVARPVGSL